MSSDDEYWAERRREESRAYRAMREIEEEERFAPRRNPLPFQLPIGFLIHGGAAFLLSLLVEYLVWGMQSAVVQVWRGFGWPLPVSLLAWMLGAGHIFSGLAGITLLLHWLLGKLRIQVLRNVNQVVRLVLVYGVIACAMAGFIVIARV